MIIHIESKDDLELLDVVIDLFDAGDHHPPYLICSEETSEMLIKYNEERFAHIQDLKICQESDYYICNIEIDNTFQFGEVEVRMI